MTPNPSTGSEHREVVIVGTGFSGLAAAVKLRERATDFVVLERSHDVGGTWQANTYPGCRCDVPSHLYSFSFAPNPEWSELFSPQPEILDYLRQVTDRYGLRRHIRFGTALEEATWDDELARWVLRTSAGPLTCRFLVLGVGPLSEPSYPDIPGLDGFTGEVMHSARWRHDIDLTGARVGVVGTGASAIQIVPHVQRNASQLTLFQRTPAWVLPHVNRRTSGVERAVFRRAPLVQKAVRGAIYAGTEVGSIALTRYPSLIRAVRVAGLAHLRRSVKDPDKRSRLTPTYLPGCKRLLPSEGFYRAVDQPNVELITDGITAVDGNDVVTADGTRHPLDVLVLATGFRVADPPSAHSVHGRDGSLAKRWADDGVHAYLGSTVPGFPNLVFLAGPNTGIGHTSLVVMIEAQVRYLLGMLDAVEVRRASTVEVRHEVCAAYNAEIQRRMQRTVWSTGGCQSWYLDAQGRNPTLWPDFTYRFVRRTRRFDPEHYDFGRR